MVTHGRGPGAGPYRRMIGKSNSAARMSSAGAAARSGELSGMRPIIRDQPKPTPRKFSSPLPADDRGDMPPTKRRVDFPIVSREEGASR